MHRQGCFSVGPFLVAGPHHHIVGVVAAAVGGSFIVRRSHKAQGAVGSVDGELCTVDVISPNRGADAIGNRQFICCVRCRHHGHQAGVLRNVEAAATQERRAAHRDIDLHLRSQRGAAITIGQRDADTAGVVGRRCLSVVELDCADQCLGGSRRCAGIQGYHQVGAAAAAGETADLGARITHVRAADADLAGSGADVFNAEDIMHRIAVEEDADPQRAAIEVC